MALKIFNYVGVSIALMLLLSNKCYAQSFDQRGLKGKYFNNVDFTDSVLIRKDKNINFNWDGKQPDPAITGSEFSVRWLGYIIPKSTKKYTFYHNYPKVKI